LDKKLKKVGAECYVAHVEERRNADKVLAKTLEGRNHMEDQCVDGRMVL
jgi:hypothetical protein